MPLWENFFEDWETFNQATGVHAFLEKAGMYEDYKHTGEQRIDILAKSLDRAVMVRNTKHMIDVIAKYTDSHDEKVIVHLISICVQFAYPHRQGPWSEHFAPYKFSQFTKDLIDRLDIPMEGTVKHNKTGSQRQIHSQSDMFGNWSPDRSSL